FRRVKTKGRGKTYYDPADPSPNIHRISDLINDVLKTSQVDVLSLNENETICFASMLNDQIKLNQQQGSFEKQLLEAAIILTKPFPARIDLHTTVFSATLTRKKEAIVPAFKVKVLRATGAGDAWNAGNILGYGNALSDECRLLLANAVAAYYISEPHGVHPTRQNLIKFIKNSTLKSEIQL
ncbi:MAG: PfkB family carbohydrate kinase, partial [Candidatus Bathyarchaeota archaeon]|nr:PfkB family carbohydrate kinase [Candidatus Bathyarchaeota archaeon]